MGSLRKLCFALVSACGLAFSGSFLPGAAADDPAAAQEALRRQELAAQFDQGHRYALLVGVNAYKDRTLSALRFCVADAELMADVLVKRCAYPAAHVTLLADGQPADRLPTQANIVRHLDTVLKRARAADTVLIYFACHGGVVGGSSLLFPTDFDSTNAGLYGVRVEHVRDGLHSCAASQKLLVLDACHSGGAKAGLSLGLSGEDLAGGKKAGGLVTFAAARRSQLSLENPKLAHGIFTYSLARGLGGEADTDKDGIVDSDETYRFVLLEVAGLAKSMGAQQTPVRIIGEDVTGILALARVAGEPYKVKVPPPPTELKAGAPTRNSVGMELVVLLPGTISAGSPPDEAERTDDERPRRFALKRPILFGATEVTQGQFEQVMGSTPSWFRPGGPGAGDVAGVDAARLPVEQVTLAEAFEFCKRLSELPAEAEAGRAYRLPSEDEWEYACRAGTRTAFSTGPLLVPSQANVDGMKPYLDAPEAPGLKRPAVVGSYPANAWGLKDMHGNVCEWCSDLYDPSRPGGTHVTRGGSFLGPVAYCRSAARGQKNPEFRHKTVGFRVLCLAKGISDR